MLAVRKLKSYQIPDDIRELIADACDRGGYNEEEIVALRKIAVLLRSPEVAFSVVMSADAYGEL